MCTAPNVNNFMRNANAASTLGLSEVVRNNTQGTNLIDKASQLTETGPSKIYNAGAKVFGADPLPGSYPDAPAAPTPSAGTGSDAGPDPTPTPANPTDLAAMIAKKKLAAMRMGLLSTIATSGQGVNGAPNLFAPAAYAVGTSGMKTALGQ